MLDMGFETQIRQLVTEADMPTFEEGRRTVMFSATFPSSIQLMANRYLRDYVFISIGLVGSTHAHITQEVVFNPNPLQQLSGILNSRVKNHQKVLVFCETRVNADKVSASLVDQGYSAVAIHGERAQFEREQALDNFRKGRNLILVATSVAARGLDIPNVALVVNYVMPRAIDDYVHRIGRTGRNGNSGAAITFITDKSGPVLHDLFDVLKEAQQDIPPWFQNMLRSIERPYHRATNTQSDFRQNKAPMNDSYELSMGYVKSAAQRRLQIKNWVYREKAAIRVERDQDDGVWE
eukprot:Platyproteum_vivax@DN6097_c0_g1_i1.p1